MKTANIKPFDHARDIYLSDAIDEVTLTDLHVAVHDIIRKDEQIINDNCDSLASMGQEFVDLYKSTLKYEPITLYLCSPGGSVYHGFGIYDFIKMINAKGKQQIRIIVNGFIASMATIICLAAEDRVCTPNSSFMIHSISDWNIGKLEDLRDNLAEAERLAKILSKVYTDNTTITNKQLKEIDKRKKDWWFDANTAVEIGLVKSII